MYAVIRAGGKQYKVSKGDVIEVEKVRDASGTIEFTPLLVVDDDGKTRSDKADLSGVKVTATVLGETKGPKVDIFRYRSKTGYRRHTGHRQQYTSLQIEDIAVGGSRGKKTTAKKTTQGSSSPTGSKMTTKKSSAGDEQE